MTALDEPTAEWAAPGPPADDDTDPIGFAPIYQPPVDPFTDEFPSTGNGYDSPIVLPGWTAPDEPPRRSRKPLVAGAVVVLVLAGLSTVILLAPRLIGGPRRMEPAAMSRGASLSAPRNGRTEATFTLLDGAAQVRLRAADLGDTLYRVNTPPAGGTPRDDGDGRISLPGRPASVEVVLNAAVRWRLILNGGSDQTRADLTGALVDAIDLTGGARQIDLTLPAPRSVVAVRMTGGVDQFRVSVPGATPVRVQVGSGAGRVTMPGATYQGIAPGRSFTANGWTAGAAGIDVQAVAGMSALTVTAGG